MAMSRTTPTICQRLCLGYSPCGYATSYTATPIVTPTWLRQGLYMATLATTPTTTSTATPMTMPTTMLHNYATRLRLQIVFMVACTR